jgi:hypothetical protein
MHTIKALHFRFWRLALCGLIYLMYVSVMETPDNFVLNDLQLHIACGRIAKCGNSIQQNWQSIGLYKRVFNIVLSVRHLRMEQNATKSCNALFSIALICFFHVELLPRCISKYFYFAEHGISSSDSFSLILSTSPPFANINVVLLSV